MKNVTVFLLISMLAVFSYGCGSSASASGNTPSDDPAVQELQQKVTTLESTISTMAGRILSLESITPTGSLELQQKVTTLESTISTLTGRISLLESSAPTDNSAMAHITMADNYTLVGIMQNPVKSTDTESALFFTEAGISSVPSASTRISFRAVTAGRSTIVEIYSPDDEDITMYATLPTASYSAAVKAALIKEMATIIKNINANQSAYPKGSFEFLVKVS